MKQPEKWLCAPTALSILAGDYHLDTLVKRFRANYPDSERNGFTIAELLYEASYIGIHLTPYVDAPQFPFLTKYRGYWGILCGVNPGGVGHALAKVGRDLIDPATGKRTYINLTNLSERVFLAWTKKS